MYHDARFTLVLLLDPLGVIARRIKNIINERCHAGVAASFRIPCIDPKALEEYHESCFDI
jgi:hypothetical protein